MSASVCESVPHSDGRTQLLRVWAVEGSPVACLVLVHGYAEHSGRYERVGSVFAASGIAVVATDLRGHGRSSGERASVQSIEELQSDVAFAAERARRIEPGKRLFVLGHSMGGLVATRYFLDAQDSLAGLVLSGAAVGDPGAFEPLLALDPLPDVVLSSDQLASDPEVGREYDADPLNYRGPFRRETLAAMAGGARAVRQRWGEIEKPVLVLHGDEDAIVLPAASEDLFAGVSSRDRALTVYPGLRHEILNEPEGPEIAARIASWILARA